MHLHPVLLVVSLSLLFGGGLSAGPKTAGGAKEAESLKQLLALEAPRALRAFGVPGAAVAVVKDGEILLAEGYGLRRLGAPEPVDVRTRFQVASNSKAFTAALLAILVDEGRLAWNDRVIDHLPDFRLWDPYVTRELTVRDLLTHRSGLGLGAGDLLWYRSSHSREEILRRLRHIPPATSFRSAYAYDNVLYIAAGEVAAKVGGKPFEMLLKERILEPLGLESASAGYRSSSDDASPHARVDGVLNPVKPDDVPTANAAGGLQMNVRDLAIWVKAQLALGQGKDGKRLWSEARSREMWEAVTPIGIRAPQAKDPLATLTPAFRAYGLGWSLRDYRGQKLVGHTGALSGMTSRVMLVPEKALGVVVLTNGESALYDALTYRVVDHFLGAPVTDWTAAFQAAEGRGDAEAAAEVKRLEEARNRASRPSLPLPSYAGQFEDVWYGRASLGVEGEKLVLRFLHSPAFTGVLEPWQYDTFRVRWQERTIPDALLTFSLDAEGRVEQFRMKALSPAADFSFDFHDLCFKPLEGKLPERGNP